MNQTNWLDTAVSGIRFGPDRAEVRAELAAHIEDKAADLARIFPDIPAEEARDRALAGMGDPEELKISLARIHRPWLGRLWTLARVIYAVTAVMLLQAAIVIGFSALDWEGRLSIFGSRETAWDQEVLDRSVVLVPDGTEVRSDGCRLTMERAWLVEDPEQKWRVQIELLVRDFDIWVDYHNFVHRIAAVDGEGTRYPDNLPHDLELAQYTSCTQSPHNPPMLTNPFEKRYILSVCGVDPDLEVLRLEYDWLGRSFSMTIQREEAGL